MDNKKLANRSSPMTCKECGEEVIEIAEKVEIPIRSASTAIEIIADDVCLSCLKRAIDGKAY